MAIKIGKIKLKNKGILAPMLEYTNLSFRQLCAKNYCALLYTEMIHINHILNNSSVVFDTKDEDYPLSLQLVGDFTNRKLTISAVNIIEKTKGYDIIDFNLGCPSPKIAAGKAGATLLQRMDCVSKTLKEIKETTTKPITAKIRLGYDFDNSLEIIKKLEWSGIDAVAIHGRLAIQDYFVPSDYNKVISLTKETALPIIYNGDISLNNHFMFENIDSFLALMIGRAALTSPSIFCNIANKKQCSLKENLIDFYKISKKHRNPLINQKLVLLKMISGFKGSRQLRAKISSVKKEEELFDCLKEEIEKHKKY